MVIASVPMRPPSKVKVTARARAQVVASSPSEFPMALPRTQLKRKGCNALMSNTLFHSSLYHVNVLRYQLINTTFIISGTAIASIPTEILNGKSSGTMACEPQAGT